MWFAIRLIITFGIIFEWTLKQLDFVMSYPQASIECNLYMDLMHCINVKGANSKDYALCLLADVYG